MALRQLLTLAAFALACVLACPAGVFARAKTDLVFLANGDRLTGEIKQLDRGILQLSTDAISTINIEWEDVDSLSSVYQFRVENQQGDKFFGAIFLARAGLLQVVSAGHAVEVHADSVVAITPLEASFLQQLDGAVSLGYSYTRADELSQFTLDSWIQRQTTIRRTRLDFDWIITNSSASNSQMTYDASLDHRKLLRATLFAQLTGEVQRNDQLGLDLRTSFAAALGSNLIQSNRTGLTASAGLSVNREWASDGTQSDNLEGVIIAEHEMFAYDFPKIDYSTQLSVYPGLSEWGRVRTELDIHMRREIVKDFFLELTFYDSYDNRPPGGGTKTDYGLIFSIGYSF